MVPSQTTNSAHARDRQVAVGKHGRNERLSCPGWQSHSMTACLDKESGGFGDPRGWRNPTQVKFQNAGNGDDGVRAIAVLKQRKLERLRPVYEQSAALMPPILGDPTPATVLAEQED